VEQGTHDTQARGSAPSGAAPSAGRTPGPMAHEPIDAKGPEQPSLPWDEPVPFDLTARGRRLVAADALPRLRVVDGMPHQPVDLDGPDDTRRVRARALQRAGLSREEIAGELDADPLHVDGWVGDLPHVPRLRVVRPAAPPPAPGGEPGPAVAPDGPDGWDEAVAAAREEAARRTDVDPGLRAGLGLLGALLRPDRHALLLDSDEAALLVAAWAWTRVTLQVDEPELARLLVRHAPDEPGDRVAHRCAEQLGLDPSRVATTRDPGVPVGRPRLRLRLADPEVALRAAGWREHLLQAVADAD